MNTNNDQQNGKASNQASTAPDLKARKMVKKSDKKIRMQEKLPIPAISTLSKFMNYTSGASKALNMRFQENLIKAQAMPSLVPKNLMLNQIPHNINRNMGMMNMSLPKNNNNMMNMNYGFNPKFSQYGKKSRIPFTAEEDEKIKFLTEKYGTKNWSLIASYMHERTPKQCRDRYSNYLVPGYFKGEWSKEEDELLQRLYNEHGPKWSILKKSFPYRSSNSLKNRWNYFLCRQEGTDEKNDNEKGKFFEIRNEDYSRNDLNANLSSSANPFPNDGNFQNLTDFVPNDSKDEATCLVEPDNEIMDILEHNYIVELDNDWIVFN